MFEPSIPEISTPTTTLQPPTTYRWALVLSELMVVTAHFERIAISVEELQERVMRHNPADEEGLRLVNIDVCHLAKEVADYGDRGLKAITASLGFDDLHCEVYEMGHAKYRLIRRLAVVHCHLRDKIRQAVYNRERFDHSGGEGKEGYEYEDFQEDFGEGFCGATGKTETSHQADKKDGKKSGGKLMQKATKLARRMSMSAFMHMG